MFNNLVVVIYVIRYSCIDCDLINCIFFKNLLELKWVCKNFYEKLYFIMYDRKILSEFGNSIERVQKALEALRNGRGVLVMDDKNRENEGDMIFAAENMTVQQMALAIRHGSGIVCLCLTEDRCNQLNLPMMVENNSNRYKTAFTVTIEASQGITTGVSALDRLTTIKASVRDYAKPSDLNRPGHVFPLKACSGGVLARLGHTEAAVDLTALAGLKPFGVLCEVVNDDGSMANILEIVEFSRQYDMPVLTISDLIAYRMNGF